MNVLDRNDISEINALILKIKEYGEYCENCVDVKFDSNKKQIEV
jgi:hypothetical protein